MMAFLTINGYELPVLDASADVSTESIGYEARSYSGKLLQSTRGRARIVKATTPILTATEAAAVRGLLQGLGHYWEFNDKYSSRGLSAASGSSTHTVSGGKITVTSGGTVTYNTNVGSNWSLIVYDDTEAQTYSLDSDGVKYESGTVSSDTVSNIADVSSGDLQLYGKTLAGANANKDYLFAAVVPYVFTTDMHVAFSTGTNFTSELPRLTVSGNVVGGVATTMRLQHGSLSEEPIQFMSSGSIATGFKLSFTLAEVL
jgi:hypothetical protein